MDIYLVIICLFYCNNIFPPMYVLGLVPVLQYFICEIWSNMFLSNTSLVGYQTWLICFDNEFSFKNEMLKKTSFFIINYNSKQRKLRFCNLFKVGGNKIFKWPSFFLSSNIIDINKITLSISTNMYDIYAFYKLYLSE